MPIGSPQWMYNSGGDFTLDQSLRFNDDDSPYLSWTPASAGNRKTWTFSAWVKRGNLSLSGNAIFSAGVSSGARGIIDFNNTDTLRFGFNDGSSWYIAETTAKFRDTSAWYHVLVKCDLANTTALIYVNNVVQDTNSVSWPNADQVFNNTVFQGIGRTYVDGSLFDGYLAEVNFIDGQALTPADFGETGDYGEWKPKAYSGSYGTNGFYLPFKQDYTVEGFSTVTWKGNAGNHYIGGVGFQPDLTWIKRRDSSYGHSINDAVRTFGNRLDSSSTAVEADHTSSFSSVDSDGFTLSTTSGTYNASAGNYVAWNWDMGGSNASNTDGSITSTVRANPTYGQSIVSYNGTGSAATIGHGLSSAPEMVIVKNRSAVGDWWTWHTAISIAEYIRLNLTGAKGSSSTLWNNTAPTSSVFSLGNNAANTNTETYIAYCFHSVTGYSKFGSYTGNGSANHSITGLGFKPAFLLIKRTNSAHDWVIVDNARNPNGTITSLANTSDAESNQEGDDVSSLDSDGFKVGVNARVNGNNDTYIYMAFADKREYAYWLDQSGNNNDWTSNNLTESDISVDSPTNNFATLNPLDTGTSGMNLAEGNTKCWGVGATWCSIVGTHGISSGKWYWETCNTHSTNIFTGLAELDDISSLTTMSNGFVGRTAGSYGYYSVSGVTYNNDSSSSYGASWLGAGDVIGTAFDADAGTLTFYKNGVSQGQAYSGISSNSIPVFSCDGVSRQQTVNFGQDSSFAGNKTAQGNQDGNGIGDFYYTPPTGYLALCTSNLPAVAVVPSEHFNTVLYSGTGSSNARTGIGFQPDMVWIKDRTHTESHRLFDSVRGVQNNLTSIGTHIEWTDANSLTAFGSDGFTVGSENAVNGVAGHPFVAWNWKANGSGSSNTNGDITSTVSANVDAGFSIVTWTSPGLSSGQSATVGHGLSTTPDMIIIKRRDSAGSWSVGTTSLGWGNFLYLDTTAATGTSAGAWNNTAPTSSVFTIGSYDHVSSGTQVAYCFHSVDGYSKVGSYTGNGNADGTFVYTGFRPAFVMAKVSTAGTHGWGIYNSKSKTYNYLGNVLQANATNAEMTSEFLDFTSNGFKHRTSSTWNNGSGQTYIYIAFAETPFKFSNAR